MKINIDTDTKKYYKLVQKANDLLSENKITEFEAPDMGNIVEALHQHVLYELGLLSVDTPTVSYDEMERLEKLIKKRYKST